MPKTTSTPTASSDRTRLCAPVMPLTGSAAASAVVRAVVSTPSVACAAAWVGAVGLAGAGPAPGAGPAEVLGVAAVRPGLLVVLISTISLGAGGVRRRTPVGSPGHRPDHARPTKNPSCRWHGGAAR